MKRRWNREPFNPFAPASVDKKLREIAEEHERQEKLAEDRAKRKKEQEAHDAEWNRKALEEEKERARLAEAKREEERLERENKRFRSPSLGPDFYNDLCEKDITKLSQYEKLIILSIHGLRKNPEEYNDLGLFINYLEANFESEKEKKKELEDYISIKDTWNTNYIEDLDNSPYTKTLKDKLQSLEELVRYHHKNCPIRGTSQIREIAQTCVVCETTAKAIELLTEAKYLE